MSPTSAPCPTPRSSPASPTPAARRRRRRCQRPDPIPDLPPAENPSLEEKAPDTIKEEVTEGEDTSTKATRGENEDEEHEPEKESPA